MPTFKDLKSLMKYVQKDVKQGMKKVGEEAKKVAKEHVDKDVYAVIDPVEYERTGELRDSIDSFELNSKKQNEESIVIQHDVDKINAYPDGFQHYSKEPNGFDPDVSDVFMEWVHDGKSGGAFGNGKWRKPRPYMKNAKDDIKQNNIHVNELKKDLKSKGYKIE